MKTRISLGKRVCLPIVGSVLLFLVAACGGGGPEQLTIPIKLEHGSLSPGTIQVKQGDTLTLKIETEESGELHLHGYDIEMELEAGAPADFLLEADVTGRYKITFHASDHASDEGHVNGDGHGEIFDSGHIEPGATFTYIAEAAHEGDHIPFHSNLHPEINGLIIVSANADTSGDMAIEIVDTEAIPQEVTVAPGTSIIWANNSSQVQEIVSGFHNAEAEEHKEEQHEEKEDEEELEVGVLEVRPR